MWRRCGVCSEKDVKWQVHCKHNELHAIITSRIAGGEPLVTATFLKQDEWTENGHVLNQSLIVRRLSREHAAQVTRHTSQHSSFAFEFADELVHILHFAASLAHGRVLYGRDTQVGLHVHLQIYSTQGCRYYKRKRYRGIIGNIVIIGITATRGRSRGNHLLVTLCRAVSFLLS